MELKGVRLWQVTMLGHHKTLAMLSLSLGQNFQILLLQSVFP